MNIIINYFIKKVGIYTKEQKAPASMEMKHLYSLHFHKTGEKLNLRIITHTYTYRCQVSWSTISIAVTVKTAYCTVLVGVPQNLQTRKSW